MNQYAGVENFLFELERINKSFVVKDFVGFLNWEPTVGALLLPYTGHHALFCQTVKCDPALYHRCVVCSNYSSRLCVRRREPFWSTCYLGVSEYTVPLLIANYCVGSISVGTYNQNEEASRLRLERASLRYGVELESLQSSYARCTLRQMPSEDSFAVFRFAAAFLADTFSPYAEENLQSLQRSRPPVNDFERVRHYIHLNYTDPTISVASIARACSYSPSSVSHIFNTKMNMNIRTYINQLRIVLAKKELRGGGSVAAAAMACGFNDSNYFSKVFRSLVGIPPSQYAKYEKKKFEFRMLPGMEG